MASRASCVPAAPSSTAASRAGSGPRSAPRVGLLRRAAGGVGAGALEQDRGSGRRQLQGQLRTDEFAHGGAVHGLQPGPHPPQPVVGTALDGVQPTEDSLDHADHHDGHTGHRQVFPERFQLGPGLLKSALAHRQQGQHDAAVEGGALGAGGAAGHGGHPGPELALALLELAEPEQRVAEADQQHRQVLEGADTAGQFDGAAGGGDGQGEVAGEGGGLGLAGQRLGHAPAVAEPGEDVQALLDVGPGPLQAVHLVVGELAPDLQRVGQLPGAVEGTAAVDQVVDGPAHHLEVTGEDHRVDPEQAGQPRRLRQLRRVRGEDPRAVASALLGRGYAPLGLPQQVVAERHRPAGLRQHRRGPGRREVQRPLQQRHRRPRLGGERVAGTERHDGGCPLGRLRLVTAQLPEPAERQQQAARLLLVPGGDGAAQRRPEVVVFELQPVQGRELAGPAQQRVCGAGEFTVVTNMAICQL